MPLFMESSSDRAFERMMAAVPGFQSKRYGRKEALTGLAPKAIVREGTPMDFRDERHRLAFSEAVRRRNKENNALMAALYLLTAESRLWLAAKPHVEKNAVHFDAIRLQDSAENAYAMFCCAIEMYLGTKHLSLTDLADKDLIQAGTFALICRAIAIRRFGLIKTERL